MRNVGEDYFIFRVVATDVDGDPLLYTLYAGNSPDKLIKVDSTYNDEGNWVFPSTSGYAPFTTFYFKVTVSDGCDTVEGQLCKATTVCYTTKCSGPFNNTAKCDKCDGKGRLGDVCPGVFRFYEDRGVWTSMYCSNCDNRYRSRRDQWNCTVCGNGMFKYYCGQCGKFLDSTNEWHNDNSVECDACNGSGIKVGVKVCKHQKTRTHFYCSHGQDYTRSFHGRRDSS